MAVMMNRKSRTCLPVALQYAHDRVTFRKPLISNQVIRQKFAALAKDIEAHWAWLEQICYHVKVNGGTDDLASRIALVKVFGGQMLERSCREAQQVLGGAGYQMGVSAGRLNKSAMICA
jgi:alkylation response protein AidB-like acyl-CoA dehydrogenase